MNAIIVGGGRVGSHLAELLAGRGYRVRLIERRPDVVAALRGVLPPGDVLLGSGADPLTLEAAGIRGAAVVAAVTGADETNLVTTCLARFEFGVQRTLARVNDPRNAWLFNGAMGVDLVLNQADVIARLIVEELARPAEESAG